MQKENHEQNVVSMSQGGGEYYELSEVEPYIRYDEVGQRLVSDDRGLVDLLVLTTNGDPKKIKALLAPKGDAVRRAVLADTSNWIRLTLLAKALQFVRDPESPPNVVMRATKLVLEIIKGATLKRYDLRQMSRVAKATGRLKGDAQLAAIEKEFFEVESDEGSEQHG